MRKGTVFAALAVVVIGGSAAVVLATRLAGALDEIDAAAQHAGIEARHGGRDVVVPDDSAVAVAPVADISGPSTATISPSPADAFLATRAEIDRRGGAGAVPPRDASLSPADIAGLLASDPNFQSALLDLARDADPAVRREATRFLTGVEGGAEPVAPE